MPGTSTSRQHRVTETRFILLSEMSKQKKKKQTYKTVVFKDIRHGIMKDGDPGVMEKENKEQMVQTEKYLLSKNITSNLNGLNIPLKRQK